MKKLTIVFTKSRKKFAIGSKAIMFYTKQNYSHVARKVTISDWEPSYYQASGSQVNYETEDIFLSKHEIVKEYTIEVPDNLAIDISRECWEDCGKKYGVKQNLGIVLVDICRFFGIKIKNPWKDGRNCSELLYIHVFKKLYPELDYNSNIIKPHHIEQIIINKCKHKYI